MLEAIKLFNLGTVNKNKVSITWSKKQGMTHEIELWFSYETIIAIRTRHGMYVSRNEWSTTTGKLLNELEPDKSRRVSQERIKEEVENALQEAS